MKGMEAEPEETGEQQEEVEEDPAVMACCRSAVLTVLATGSVKCLVVS